MTVTVFHVIISSSCVVAEVGTKLSLDESLNVATFCHCLLMLAQLIRPSWTMVLT